MEDMPLRAQSLRCTGAGRASNPDFRPYPVINLDKVTRDFGVNTPYRGPKPSMRVTLQPPVAYPNRESGARLQAKGTPEG